MRNTISTAPVFRLRCLCAKRLHRFAITGPTGTRIEPMCSVCAAQLEALGYTTRLIG